MEIAEAGFPKSFSLQFHMMKTATVPIPAGELARHLPLKPARLKNLLVEVDSW
ncbi:MAG: hypothetical protein RML33_10915 [Acidobacteriota bacterium]|nr:hypothetical protein [Acidobacteriota bacterium]